MTTKKILLFLLIFIISFSCKEKKVNLNSFNNISKIFEKAFYNTVNENFNEYTDSLNQFLINKKNYKINLMIEKSNLLEREWVFNDWIYNSNEIPDIGDLTVCYKSKDSILINNLDEKK